MPSSRIVLSSHIKGLNLKLPLDSMPADTCFVMDNLIPDTDGDRLRPGFDILELAELGEVVPKYISKFISGSNKHLVLKGDDDTFYSFDPETKDQIASLATSTDYEISSGQFTDGAGGQLLFICEETEGKIITYNGVNFSSTGSFTIPSGVKPSRPTSFKNRLYFINKGTTSIYYGGVQAVSGTLTLFDVSSFMSLGGYIVGLVNWRQNSSVGIQNVLAIITSEGEVLVYSGTSPEATDWQLNGVYTIPRPIGKNFYELFASDVFITTENGVFLLSQIIPQDGQNVSAVSDAINPAFYSIDSTYKDIVSPVWLKTLGLVFVIYGDNKIFAYNVRTGAWCNIVGYNAVQIVEIGSDVIFLNSSDELMKITPGVYTDYPNNTPISYYKQGAFIKSQDGTINQVLRVKPWVKSLTAITIYKRIMTDFIGDTSGIIATNNGATSTSMWDVAEWDTSFWTSEGVLDKYKGVVQSVPAQFNSVGYFGQSNQQLTLMSSEIVYITGTGDA